MIPIRQIFTLGARCNTDHLLKKMGLRHFSSPFSFMLINGATAAHFIRPGFAGFTLDLHRVRLPHHYRWAGRPMHNQLFFNLLHPRSIHVTGIDQLDQMCIWDHHDFTNPEIQQAFRRRETRLLDALNNSPADTLLLYIAKPRILADDSRNHCDVSTIRELTDDYQCHALILLSYLNFNHAPYFFQASTHLHMISYQATPSNDVKEASIAWEVMEKTIRKQFIFPPDQ